MADVFVGTGILCDKYIALAKIASGCRRRSAVGLTTLLDKSFDVPLVFISPHIGIESRNLPTSASTFNGHR